MDSQKTLPEMINIALRTSTEADDKKENTNTSFEWVNSCGDNVKDYLKGINYWKHGKYMSIMLLIVFIHYISVSLYYKNCIVTFYNMFMPVSPVCHYLLEVINLCSSFLEKIVYFIGGYLILTITNVFGNIKDILTYEKP